MEIKQWHFAAALMIGSALGFIGQEYVSCNDAALVPVIVAGMDIPRGTVLCSKNLRVIKWPREYLPANSAEKVEQVEGLIITQPVAKGEPVLLPKLAKSVRKEVT